MTLSANNRPLRALRRLTSSNPRLIPEADAAPFSRLDEVVRFTRYGASCYSYACLARGRNDLAVDAGFDAQDLFAPTAIVEGAGCTVTDWQGVPLGLSRHGRVAAGGEVLHGEALKRLAYQDRP